MALSDTTVRLARATGTDYTLGDADGLALFVTAQGSKSWHFRFCWGGKQPRISLGIYPEISLRDARTRRDEARNLVAKGIDPRVHRRQERAAATAAAANTFESVFRLWCDFKAKALIVKTDRQSTVSQINRIFAKDVLPYLGKRSIFEVARADVVEVLCKIERRNALTMASECRTWFNQLFRYAMVEVNLATNPAAGRIYRPMIDVKRYSTHTRRRTESVATELLAGGVTVEAGKSKLVGTRRDVERGWFAVSEILSREGQSELATQIRHFVHQMLPAVTEKEWAASELVS